MIPILLGTTELGEEIFYNYIPYESRGIAISAATRSGKSTLLFENKRQVRKQVPEAQIVSIARDRDEFRQRDEIPFIIAGERGEIPLDPKLSNQLGQLTRKMHLDLILDVNSLQTEKEQDEEMSGFINGLQMDHDERFWKKPCFLYIDEVQMICKQGVTAFPKTRDAIVKLAHTCLKKNILPTVASHKMKDFYVNARDELTNHVVGYLDNIDQQEFACELLKLPKSESKIIDSFGETRGKFYVRGFDICKKAEMIQVKPSKLYPKGEVIIPKLDYETLQKAQALRESINLKDDISIETQLRFENAELQGRVDLLSMNQMTPENMKTIFRNGVLEGYRQSTNDQAKMVREFIRNNSGIFGKFKRDVVTIKQIEDSEGKTRLVL